jgi:hypothetical protein
MSLVANDLFKFWSVVGSADKVHPDDRCVLERVNHGFNLNCLPANFMGRLRDAPVVLLYLSSGFTDDDLAEAQSERGQNRYMRTRQGYEPLPGPNDHKGAWRWWESRTRRFGDWSKLQSKVAVLNIGSYHSKEFVDEPLLAALPSSRASLDWAQRVLFPQAIAGDRIVVCLRSARFWGLENNRKYGAALYAPPVTRSGHMRDSEMRAEIVELVRNRLSGCGRPAHSKE